MLACQAHGADFAYMGSTFIATEEANASEKLERTSSGRMLSNVLCWSKEGKNETGGLFGRAHIKREKLVLVQDIAPTVAYKNGRDRAFCLATPSTMLVLVADDVEMNRDVMCTMLRESLGCTSEEAEDGTEAVSAVRAHRCNAVRSKPSSR